jgi:Protein of unknown function (DUF3888)
MVFMLPTCLVYATTINETESQLCDAYKYALIQSLRAPGEKGIQSIYKDDKHAPESLSWDAYDTEVLQIRQLYGVGGSYEITLKIKPYYRAHITYGVDEITIRSDGTLIRYEHLKTYP